MFLLYKLYYSGAIVSVIVKDQGDVYLIYVEKVYQRLVPDIRHCIVDIKYYYDCGVGYSPCSFHASLKRLTCCGWYLISFTNKKEDHRSAMHKWKREEITIHYVVRGEFNAGHCIYSESLSEIVRVEGARVIWPAPDYTAS